MATVSLLSGSIGRPFAKLLLSSQTLLSTRVALVHGKALRPDNYERYPAWPYKEKSYNQFHFWIDNTTKRFDANSKVIFVEGMPALGKSAFAETLAEDLDMKYFPMVTMDLIYVNYHGYDTRKLDPELPKAVRSFDEKRFIREPSHPQNIVFQSNELMLKTYQYMDALAHILNTGQGVVIERSPFSDFVFAEAMYKCKYMDRVAYNAYYRYYQAMTKLVLKPHLVIYLDAPNNVVYENLKNRGQGEEKTLTLEYLETMEEKYKFKFLKDIEEHAEVLIYDWSVPGDVEVIVEDIERINFDKWETEADTHHPKMKDWRWENEEDANERRWEYTHRKHFIITATQLNSNSYECDAEFVTAEDKQALWDKLATVPGMKYEIGYDPSAGDKFLFKRRNKQIFPELMKRNFLWDR